MNAMLQRLSLGMLLLCAFSAAAACEWPGWQQYKQFYISPQGRVIDPSSPNKI
ncbi:endo-1,4-D-glucanase, partial [Klebsiella pneumoniae]|nr:endo-1,4-D-glucanase [Klebsiella pneumoniae]